MRTLLFAFGAAALVGCTSITPVGPLAKYAPAPKTAPKVPAEMSVPAVKPTPPTPPTVLVTPSDVSAETAHDAASKLTSELGMDSKSPVNGPVTVEVSRLKVGNQ